jgi:hypothetical protein
VEIDTTALRAFTWKAMKEYWPALVGVVLGSVTLIVLWPEPQPEVGETVQRIPRIIPPNERSKHPIDEDAKPRPAARPERLGPQETLILQLPPPRVEIRETLILQVEAPKEEMVFHDYDQDNPEVKKALRDVKIEVYAPADDASAKQATTFFQENNLSFTEHDTRDALQEEKARRLVGSAEQPEGLTLVVDGQVLRGFSEKELNAALIEALKKRVP